MAPPVTTTESPNPQPTRPWLRPALLLAGTVVIGDGLSHVLPLHGEGLLALGALAGGLWWWRHSRQPLSPRLPDSLSGWIDRCEQLLERFERLEGELTTAQQQRQQQLLQLRQVVPGAMLRLALVGGAPPPLTFQPAFLQALRGRHRLQLEWGHALPAVSRDWRWPECFRHSDLVLYHLRLPLSAVDLRWLEALPARQPLWLLVESAATPAAERLLDELTSQWPGADPARLLLWDGRLESLAPCLEPLLAWLGREGRSLMAATPLRCFEALHQDWQADLEQLRRREWQQLQQRTQWLVAAGVFASPLPSVDLMVLAAANGLMLQEMARLWDCPWQGEQLRAAALELGRAALALGVVEWSSQALLGVIRLDGAGWFVGGALQACSAAYLTRVVGRAMADVLALSAGVAAPDLEAIKRQAPLLVARAAEQERLDWASFLRQGQAWLQEQTQLPAAGRAPEPA